MWLEWVVFKQLQVWATCSLLTLIDCWECRLVTIYHCCWMLTSVNDCFLLTVKHVDWWLLVTVKHVNEMYLHTTVTRMVAMNWWMGMYKLFCRFCFDFRSISFSCGKIILYYLFCRFCFDFRSINWLLMTVKQLWQFQVLSSVLQVFYCLCISRCSFSGCLKHF